MAQAEGYIKERDLRMRRYIPIISAADQVGPAITVTIQLGLVEKRDLVDALEANADPFDNPTTFGQVGESPSYVQSACVHLYDLTTGTHAVPAGFAITDGGAGSILLGSGGSFAQIMFDSNGKAELTITDVAGTSGKTVHIEAQCDYTGVSTGKSIEFAGA